MQELFSILNEKMKERGEIAEVGIIGDAVMCLVYNARESTKDIDAIFEPTSIIRKVVKEIATEKDIPEDWLNDAAKGYLVSGFSKQNVLTLPHLVVWAPEPRYMLAMKCLSARWDSTDKDDVIFLLNHLKIAHAKEALRILEDYYPKKRIPAKTQFFLEEILG